LKVNSDANLQEEGWWGLGTVVRDSQGFIMAAATWKCTGSDHAETAKAFGYLSAINFAKECGFRRVVIEGDNERIIRILQNNLTLDRSYPGEVLK
jgi:hypothetical protein